MVNRISSREGFVSDKLVDLGRKLQINYEIKESGNGFTGEPANPEQEKLSARRAVAERSEAERMYRELRDRIANADAGVSAELEQLDTSKAELERYKKFLGEAAETLDNLNPNSATVIRDIEEIRFRYFTASGRAQAFFGNGGGAAPVVTPSEAEEAKPFSSLLYESLPVVMAILFGALIVGVAFVIALM